MTAMRLHRYPSPSGGFALGKMGAGATMLKQGKTARDYIQNGLVAMWDGVENAGWGTHDATATTWKDLVENRNFTIVNPSWRDTGLFFGDGTCYGYLSQSNSAIFDSQSITISAVITRGGLSWGAEGIYLKPSNSGRYGLAFFFSNFTVRNVNVDTAYVFPSGVSVSVSVPYDANSGTVTPRYGNTLCVNADSNNNNIGQSQTYATIGKRVVGSNYYARGTMHTLRVYNRALTADEIAANYAIDKERFNLP